MKNFPHQINEIEKLVNALGLIKILLDRKLDVLNDGVLGYELARGGVYTFRNLNTPLEERINTEKAKPQANQGARTAARDLRRFFQMLNFITINQSGSVSITNTGDNIIKFGKMLVDESVRDIWRDALVDIELYDESNNASHPYIIMLKLINTYPGIETIKLSLAFEAINDSQNEFNRICTIAQDVNWEQQVHGSETQIRNSVKILPSLAKQLGDIVVHNGQAFPVANLDYIVNTKQRRSMQSRIVDASQIATVPNNSDNENSDNNVDMTEAIAERKRRIIRHQNLVKRFAAFLEQKGYVLHENPMDCLAQKPGVPSLLIEAKTLSGSIDDEKKQVRLALGQLLYYEYFYLHNINQGVTVQKIALFESKISDEHMQYLTNNNCVTFYIDNNVIYGPFQIS